jgi:energy-converting hydrogenase A subunit M
MKTYILILNEAQEDVIKALAKALKIDIQIIDDVDEDKGLFIAMEEGKKHGRLSEVESKAFLDSLGQ